MIIRLAGVLAILWTLGFAAFMLFIAQPAGDRRTDAIVVPTGAAGRIDRGLALLAEGQAKRMLVTGVAPGVRKVDLVRQYGFAGTIACCVDLGREAVDTRSNADETARWMQAHRYRSVRLVTSDWHMARTRMEVGAVLGDVAIVRDGVPSEQRLALLINEYNKLILRRIALWVGFAG